MEGRYSYYNLFNRAWVLDTQARIEQKRQYGFIEAAMPPDSHTYRNSIYSSYERTIDIESTDLTSWRAGLKRSRSREKYDTTVSLDFYYDNLVPFGQPEQISKALVPAFAWTRRDVDNPVFPRRGNVISTQIGVAAQNILSDATFLRMHGRDSPVRAGGQPRPVHRPAGTGCQHDLGRSGADSGLAALPRGRHRFHPRLQLPVDRHAERRQRAAGALPGHRQPGIPSTGSSPNGAWRRSGTWARPPTTCTA